MRVWVRLSEELDVRRTSFKGKRSSAAAAGPGRAQRGPRSGAWLDALDDQPVA